MAAIGNILNSLGYQIEKIWSNLKSYSRKCKRVHEQILYS